MFSAGVHTGTKNFDNLMKDFIWRRHIDGIHILNVGKTWEKLMLSARIIVSIDISDEVIAISARHYGMRAVLKFAHYTGVQSITGRFTQGIFTDKITKQFREPMLLILTDPRTLQHVNIAIPSNNKGKHSIGLLYWLIAREVL